MRLVGGDGQLAGVHVSEDGADAGGGQRRQADGGGGAVNGAVGEQGAEVVRAGGQHDAVSLTNTPRQADITVVGAGGQHDAVSLTHTRTTPG